MTRSVLTQEKTSAPLRALLNPIQRELAQFEAMLASELRSDHPFVDELVRYGCLIGGKRLRPALLLLCGKAVGQLGTAHLTLATVVEMIHTATLIHDDVLDEASTRRHLATVNSRWDNEASVLLGDFLFTHAFHLASTLDTTFACRRIGWATNRVCDGELRQKGSRGDFRLSEAEYLAIIEAKTAELTACSCELGAWYAGAEQGGAAQCGAYGRDLGIAFQIADDVLDLVGDESTAGKSLGTDLAKQKPTLPLIRLMQVLDEGLRQDLIHALENGSELRRDALVPLLNRHDAIEYAIERAKGYADRARHHLDDIPPGPAVDSLRRLTHFVVNRSA
jgi:octaprenyl-diphosphate synthase